jgi:hypothetical protein
MEPGALGFEVCGLHLVCHILAIASVEGLTERTPML